MSDEKKASEKEAAVSNYFESLIGDFIPDDIKSNPMPDVTINTDDPPKDIRDFSKFFDDATAFGSGFESTIDKPPEDISDGKEENVSFPEENTENTDDEAVKSEEQKPTITEPVTDEDGMIVIFDEEAGINATGTDMGITAEKSEASEESENEPPVEEEIHDSEPEENFEADSNIADDKNEENKTFKAEEAASEPDSTSDKASESSENTESPKKRPFIQGIIPWKGDSAPEIIRKIVFIASTGVFIAAGIMLISTLIQSEEMQEESESIAEMVTTTVATEINEDGEIVTVPPTTEERIEHNESVMDSFIELSDNVKGFIELDGCDIRLPVVQGTDNVYYLTHTYNDRKNKAGSIFMDYRCTISEDYTSPNIVLYGHNQEDGTMFGNLKFYKNNVDFYKKNPMVVFNTEYGIGDYIIFGYFVTNVYEKQDSKGEVFHYHDYIETLSNESTFNWYMGQVNERNQIIPPVDVVFGDKLLVLSTCSNEYSDSRFVVMARKVRDGEDVSAIDFSTARLNPNAKQIDWDAILSRTSPTTTSETTTVSETTTTTVTTTVTTPETTTSEVTTEATTTPRTLKIDHEERSRLGFAPIYENGTKAACYTDPTTAPEETAVPDSSDGDTTAASSAASAVNGTTAPVTEQTTVMANT